LLASDVGAAAAWAACVDVSPGSSGIAPADAAVA
jgi:hypothetical protein